MKCIYCLEDKPEDHFTKKEHVIPQSFGLFENNLTLNKEVCDECNQYFGDNLEIDLGRDTIEGIHRYDFGVKAAKDFKSLGKRSRFKFVVAEGPFKGASSYLEYSKELKDVVLKPLPQIGFINTSTKEYEYFPIDGIPPMRILDAKGLDYSRNIRPLGVSVEELHEVLSNVKIPPNFDMEHELGTDDSGWWPVEVESTIDQTIKRAIAKISFNYMAFVHGADFVLQKTFNPIRFFIRRGVYAKRVYVAVRYDNILSDEKRDRRRVMHIVTLNWAVGHKAIVSQVSLFNTFFSYTVQLTKNYKGKKIDLKRGHSFNINVNRIFELASYPPNSYFREREINEE